MSFLDLCKQRYSVRKFDSRPVEEEKLSQILEAGRTAPTAANKQPKKIYVLKSEKAREKLASVTRMTYGAPVILLICYDQTISWKSTPDTFGEDYDSGEMDACIVGTQMMYMATELGLGTLWVRGFNTEQVHKLFDLPDNIIVSYFLDIGYPSNSSVNPHTARKKLEETTFLQ